MSARLPRKRRLRRDDPSKLNGDLAARLGRGGRSHGTSQPQQATVQRKILPNFIGDLTGHPPAPPPNLVLSEVEGPGMHFRAPPTSSPSKYYCTKSSCKAEFKRAHDWKKHEGRKHEQVDIWKCPDCHEEFLEATRFRTHHRVEHDCSLKVSTNCQHTGDAHQVLLRKVAWGCGFCGSLQTSWDARCSHVARHFDRELYFDSNGKAVRGRQKSEWSMSLEIRGLLEREELAVHLETILAQAYAVEWRHGEGLGNMLRWSADELEEAGTRSLILRLQCPISPKDAYGIVYSLVAMTLPQAAWDDYNGRWKENKDYLDRDIDMLSVPNDTNDRVETRMAEFERLDRTLAMGPRDSSSDRIDEYTAFLSNRHLEGKRGDLDDLEGQDEDVFESHHDRFDTTSNISDLSSLDGPLFMKVVEDMFLEADFSMFVHQDVFNG
ncbi:hypothetical protein Vi05172_g11082 [Venturia inaequalis]|nr:hypothetical protein Vi05172_g11082 [Venturia inaequalis]